MLEGRGLLPAPQAFKYFVITSLSSQDLTREG